MTKTLAFLIALAVCSILVPAGVAQDDATPLPFGVSIGGQAAQVKGDASKAIVATVEKPVAADAALEVASKADPVIINIVAASAEGTPVEGAATAIMLIQGGSGKTTLDKTMDGKKLAAGTYLMNVVADGKTARVVFQVK